MWGVKGLVSNRGVPGVWMLDIKICDGHYLG